jgi:hypothetical protein
MNDIYFYICTTVIQTIVIQLASHNSPTLNKYRNGYNETDVRSSGFIAIFF